MTSMHLSSYQRLDYEAMAVLGPGTREPGERRLYDMCMVFKYKTSKHVEYEEQGDQAGRVLTPAPPADKSKMDMWKQSREAILKSLQNCGLQCFCFYSRDRDEIYCKIGADAAKLREVAARMKYKLQLKPEYLGAYAEYRQDFPGRPEMNFTDRRVVSHIYKTHSGDDYPTEDAIFTTMDKVLLIHHIITSKDKDCAGINVGQLLYKEELVGYFPLHEEHRLQELNVSIFDGSIFEWIWMGQEHTTKVREYFGDKIAFYFLWLSFYWKWLTPISIVGLVLQLLDVICRTPDNFTAVPFCVLLGIWSTFLPHFWRRQEAKYAIQWGSFGMEEKLEAARPEHHGEPRINPVTAQVENHYPWESRLWDYVRSVAVICLSGVMMICIILLLLLARRTLNTEVVGGDLTFEFLLAATVEIINSILSVVAKKLTEWENHRTQSEHDTHRLAKVMGFKFVNSYFALYYIAFFKKHSQLFGVTVNCFRNDCFLDLQGQLAVFVIFRLTVQNSIEFFMPRLKSAYYNMRMGQGTMLSFLQGHSQMELADMSPPEKQAKQSLFSSFEEFDESLVAHGYATLFAVTSPWVCVATIFGTIFETWIDTTSITTAKQRPMPRCSKDNEPWSTAFTVYGALAAFTNLILLIFGSQQYDAYTTTEKLVLFVLLEHLIFVSRAIVTNLFPAIPQSVVLMKLKQESVVHRCLENIKGEAEQDNSLFRDARAAEYEIFENDNTEEDADFDEPAFSVDESRTAFYDGVREVRIY